MSIELPLLRLGLIGFSIEQQARLNETVARLASGGMVWHIGTFSEADVLWVNGSRTLVQADGTLRVASGVPAGRSVQLSLAEIDRPIAFSIPLPQNLGPADRFDMNSPASLQELMAKIEGWMRPLAAQFCLASHVIDNEGALSSGVYRVSCNDTLLAVVDLQGDVGVLPSAGPADFEDAMWVHCPAVSDGIPDSFVRASLSQVMWQYALRTDRDLLPRRYRKGLLYFRRPPRVPQRMVNDTHLLLLRELAVSPTSFDDLRERTALSRENLAHDLAALYLVGAITANPKRAPTTGIPYRRATGGDADNGAMPSGGFELPVRDAAPTFNADLTAPAPMSRE